jgi:hypothetical protein
VRAVVVVVGAAAVSTAETSWGQLTVDPDVVKTLAVVTLHQISLAFLGFNFDDDLEKGRKVKGCNI